LGIWSNPKENSERRRERIESEEKKERGERKINKCGGISHFDYHSVQIRRRNCLLIGFIKEMVKGGKEDVREKRGTGGGSCTGDEKETKNWFFFNFQLVERNLRGGCGEKTYSENDDDDDDDDE
jgi:hypothetical protein